MGVSNQVMTNVWPVEGWTPQHPGRMDVYRGNGGPWVGYAVKVAGDGPNDAFAAIVIDVEESHEDEPSFNVCLLSKYLPMVKPKVILNFARRAGG